MKQKALAIVGYPFECVGRIYFLPRALGTNDSITVNGTIFSSFTTVCGLECHSMIHEDMRVLMLS